MATRHRNYVFTTNNYDTTNSEQIIRDQQTAFTVYGYEIAPSTGTPHLQGYLEWKNAKSKSATIKLLKDSWCDVANCDDPKYSIVYCCKNYVRFVMQGLGLDFDFDDEKYILDWGYVNFLRWYASPMENNFCYIRGDFKPKAMGKRTDLDEIRKWIDDGKSLYQIAKEVSNLQQLQYAKYYMGLRPPTRTWKPVVIWLYGPTGTGKTETAIEICRQFAENDKEDFWISSDSLKWFDGYMGEESVIIDDFRGHLVEWSFFLRVLDRYPLRVPIKGSFVDWCPKRIFVTSNLHPRTMFEEWCERKGEDVNQLLRRIDDIQCLDIQV